jgi:AbiU2
MSTNNSETTNQIRDNNIKILGKELGEVYSELCRDLYLIHLVWNEYLELFSANEDRYKLLNQCGARFFRVVQECLWSEVILGISRITDPAKTKKKDNLSLYQLEELVTEQSIKEKLTELLVAVDSKTKFARDRRNRQISHTDLLMALNQHTEPSVNSSEKSVSEALSSIEDVLNCIDHNLLKNPKVVKTVWLTPAGGVKQMLYYLKEGVEAVEKRKDTERLAREVHRFEK